jgi:hypothetical protein
MVNVHGGFGYDRKSTVDADQDYVPNSKTRHELPGTSEGDATVDGP